MRLSALIIHLHYDVLIFRSATKKSWKEKSDQGGIWTFVVRILSPTPYPPSYGDTYKSELNDDAKRVYNNCKN